MNANVALCRRVIV